MLTDDLRLLTEYNEKHKTNILRKNAKPGSYTGSVTRFHVWYVCICMYVCIFCIYSEGPQPIPCNRFLRTMAQKTRFEPSECPPCKCFSELVHGHVIDHVKIGKFLRVGCLITSRWVLWRFVSVPLSSSVDSHSLLLVSRTHRQITRKHWNKVWVRWSSDGIGTENFRKRSATYSDGNNNNNNTQLVTRRKSMMNRRRNYAAPIPFSLAP